MEILFISATGPYHPRFAGVPVLAGRYSVFDVLFLLLRPNRLGAVHSTEHFNLRGTDSFHIGSVLRYVRNW